MNELYSFDPDFAAAEARYRRQRLTGEHGTGSVARAGGAGPRWRRARRRERVGAQAA